MNDLQIFNYRDSVLRTIERDGLDVNYLGKLAANGYYPDNPETAAQIAPAPLPSLEIVDDGTGFAQFSLLPM